MLIFQFAMLVYQRVIYVDNENKHMIVNT